MKNARPQTAETSALDKCNHNPIQDLFPESLTPIARSVNATHQGPPLVSGQCAEVLTLIREFQPILSFEITASRAIPECAARIHDLRAMGFNIITTIHPEVVFRGSVRRKSATYSIGVPEWPAPGFNAGA